mgnify:CR=1 FL=1
MGELNKVETKEKVETSAAEYFIEDSILYMRAKKDANFTLEVTMEGIEARKKLQNGRKFPVLIDMRLAFGVSVEAREYSARDETTELYLAMAILSGKSLPARMMGNFFIKFNKPNIPLKLFSSEGKAIEWLKSFKK